MSQLETEEESLDSMRLMALKKAALASDSQILRDLQNLGDKKALQHHSALSRPATPSTATKLTLKEPRRFCRSQSLHDYDTQFRQTESRSTRQNPGCSTVDLLGVMDPSPDGSRSPFCQSLRETEKFVRRKMEDPQPSQTKSLWSQHDTQPFSQAAFERHARARSTSLEIARENIDPSSESTTALNVSTGVRRDELDDHTDLTSALGPDLLRHIPAIAGEDHGNDSVVDTSSPHFQGDVIPESKRFQIPETPGTQGRKRRRNGDFISPEVTPKLPSNPFAGDDLAPVGLMGLSQVFAATQAETPAHDRLPSDALSGRPSPDMFYNRHSPDLEPIRSPTENRILSSQRKRGDPIHRYKPMVESQEEREKSLCGLFPNPTKITSDSRMSDDDLSPGETERAYRLSRLRKSYAAAEVEIERAGLLRGTPGMGSRSGRVRQDGHPKRHDREGKYERSRHHQMTSMQNPATISDEAAAEMSTQALSDDDDSDLEMVIVTTQNRSITQGDDTLQTDSQVVEEAIQVPRTAGRSKIGTSKATQSSPSASRGTRARQHSRGRGNIAATPEKDPTALSKTRDQSGISLIVASTQTEAIIDSQPLMQPPEMANVQSSPPPCSPTNYSSIHMHPQCAISQASTAICWENIEHRHAGPESSSISQPPRGSTEDRVTSAPQSQSTYHLPGKDTTTLLKTPQLRSRFQRASPDIALVAIEPALESGEERALKIDAPQTDHPATILLQRYEPSPGHVLARAADENVPERLTPGNVDNIPRDEVASLNMHLASPHGSITPSRFAGQEKDQLHAEEDMSLDRLGTNVTQSSPSELQKHSDAPIAFDTAQNYIENSSDKQSSPQSLSQAPRWEGLLGEQRRTLSEIHQDPVPSNDLNDIELGEFGLLSTQDQEFHVTVSRPASMDTAENRRRGGNHRVPQESSALSNQKPFTPLIGSFAKENMVIIAPPPSGRDSGSALQSVPKLTAKVTAKLKRRRKPREKSMAWRRSVSGRGTRVGTPIHAGKDIPAVAAKQSILQLEAQLDEDCRRLDSPVAVEAQEADSPTAVPEELSRAASELTTNEAFKVPRRVFALFKDGKLAYHPATCLSVDHAGTISYRVRFDDATYDTLESHQVRRLTLRVGDIVKVDLNKMRTQNYVVAGFSDQIKLSAAPTVAPRPRQSLRDEIEDFPSTDAFGNLTILITPKRRDILGDRTATIEAGPISVPVTNIYVVHSNWARFHDRVYEHPSDEPSGQPARGQTPQDRILTTPGTPSTRSRGPPSPTVDPLAYSAHSSSQSKTRIAAGIFTNMTFAVSYTHSNREEANKKDEERKAVIGLISSNGGRVLTSGFEELFEDEGAPSVNEGDTHDSLRPTRVASGLGFVCLIANGHSRKAKYMQALALGLPCLASRWIQDSVGRGIIVDWEPYLLPSGESTFLRGAIRSRTLTLYPAETAKFPATIASRKLVLDGRSVLMVVGTGKAKQELRRAYIFITYALGARKLEMVGTIEDARRKVMISDEWDWVYVDETQPGSGTLLETHAASTSTAQMKSSKDKKRWRTSKGLEPPVRATPQVDLTPEMLERLRRVKVVGNEFVTQSLILGRLIEEA